MSARQTTTVHVEGTDNRLEVRWLDSRAGDQVMWRLAIGEEPNGPLLGTDALTITASAKDLGALFVQSLRELAHLEYEASGMAVIS